MELGSEQLMIDSVTRSIEPDNRENSIESCGDVISKSKSGGTSITERCVLLISETATL